MLTTEEFFETIFSGRIQGERIDIYRLPADNAASYSIDPLFPELNKHDLDNKRYDVMFTVTPRTGPNNLGSSTFAWLDIDNLDLTYEELLGEIYPRPTSIVSSGHGWHCYWAFSSPITPSLAETFSKLLTVRYGGDQLAVNNTNRFMRVPNSWNAKKKEKGEAKCELIHLEKVWYSPDDFAEHLISTSMVPYWQEGQRNALALGLGGLLVKATWDAARITRVVKEICELTGDTEVGSRIRTSVGAWEALDGGSHLSVSSIRDSFGPDNYILLEKALGIAANDGDLELNSVKIGRVETQENDIAQYIINEGNWGFSDGTLYNWAETRWKRYDAKLALNGYIQIRCKDIHITKEGSSFPIHWTKKLQDDVAGLVVGPLSYLGFTEPTLELVPLENGIYNIETGELSDHNKEYHNKWTLPFSFDPSATCPRFEEFINFALPSDDASLVTFIQEWMGYLFFPDNPFQKFVWLVGMPGTGKSTLLRVIEDLFGEAHVSFDSHDISDATVARLNSARVASCSEMDMKALKTNKLKALVSGDSIEARFLYGTPFNAHFRGKFVLASNSLPGLTETDGIARRLDVCPFDFAPTKPDPRLSEKLSKELAGIFNWCLAGYRRVRKYEVDGTWPIASKVQFKTKQYLDEADIFSRFIDECCVKDGKASTPMSMIFDAFTHWCNENGFYKPVNGAKFKAELERLGFYSPEGPTDFGYGKKERYWRGITLNSKLMKTASLEQTQLEDLGIVL